ncbi:MAG TPA: methylated-DNA--[protein]-cysteine S-methyltransferase [Mollicutes bacterium]|nr:methylated-DNA--[protein]-cysteine S-methyltransferase [Mollicutes bacterium]
MKYYYNYDTLFGSVTIVTEDEFLIKIIYGNEKVDEEKETTLIKEIKKQIDEYSIGKREKFDVPIKMVGTDFQIKVWKELIKIKFGECITYQELAKRVKNENYARAVGMANNKNPIPIIIPCHRVIGKNGNLVGYAGGIDIKKQLLEIECKKETIHI